MEIGVFLPECGDPNRITKEKGQNRAAEMAGSYDGF